jgi:RNA polymerase sigma factor (sigma-70 family)
MSAADGGPKRQESVSEWPGTSVAISATPAPKPDCSQALAEISRNHHAALVRFLTLRTGSVEDAKEIVQEAYAKMLALDRPGTISFLAGYLWRIAVNLAIDRRRQQALDERFRCAALPPVDKQEFSAESIVEARERLAIVERGIGELPPRCLEAFVLHVLNGLTFDDVGREMAISGRMAKKHVSRALEYLQTCLYAANETRSAR